MTDTDSRPEFSFIDWIKDRAQPRPEVRLGIGDDAALLAADGREWVSTVDVITEGVHFTSDTPLADVGRKALAVNLSDMAAMAAEPCAAFLGIVLPRTCERSRAEELYRGLFELAEEWNVCIAGGDTNSWNGPLVISVTLMGLVAPGKAVRRDGARPGDWICVTGSLGGSLQSGRHLHFTPRIAEAQQLSQAVSLHAMLDLSDGLGSDLFHLLDRSQVGARLNGAAIPVHDAVSQALPPSERLQHALGDGEDFELLFTVSPADGRRLMENSPVEIPISPIGEITADKSVTLLFDGIERPLPRSGWSHQFG